MNSPIRSRYALWTAVFMAVAGMAFAQVPANNNFAAATAITAGVTTAGTNVNATTEAGEPPTHWTATTATTVRSVWYSYTPAASGLATFTVVARGTGTAAAAMYGAAYSGSALNALTRIASASSIAGAAGPPATAGVGFPSNLFAVTAAVPVFIQITGSTATGAAPFDLTVTSSARNGTIVLPRYSNWEWLHPINGFDPTTAAAWETTWKNAGDPTDYDAGAGIVNFSVPQQAPLGFATLNGAPGVKQSIGTAAAGANNNAAYFRTTFTLAADTSNLWAEVVADDGAYIYIDDHPGVPVHIAARLANNSSTNNTGFADYRPQADVFITGAIPATAAGQVPGCRAYDPAGFDAEYQTKMVFLSGLAGQLSAGSHQIAVSLHQTANNSSDLAFDLQLIDMGAWPLGSTAAEITFADVPVAFPSQTTAAVPALEHHYAPNAMQSGLAWYCVAPSSSFTQGSVLLDTYSGAQNVLRFNAATDQRFVTEPVKVDGLPEFFASARILVADTSATPGFEAEDGFRIYLETSTDGVNFAEAVPPLDVQPQVNGAAAFDTFQTDFVTKSLPVSPNPHKFVRMVVTGGVDDANEEYLYFDDIRFGTDGVAAIGSIQITNTVRSPGDDLSTTADDAFTYTLLVDSIGTGPGYEIRSSDAGNTTLYGTGTYGVAGTVTLPVAVNSLTIMDISRPALVRSAAIPPAGADLAMGRTVLGGANRILYSNPTATTVISEWMQTSGTGITPPPADLELTVDETTTTLHPDALLASADAGVLESPMVDLAGFAGVTVSASLRAFEISAGSGFETNDVFKIEVIEGRAAGETTVNLIAGYPADAAPADGVLNGFSGTAAQYDVSPASDEFNAAGANAAANSRGTFQFSYAVPGDVLRVRLKVTGVNDSPNEYFFFQHLLITDAADPDTDADGLSDAWETTHFGNLAQTAAGDPDGDGQKNNSELAAGTVPTDGTSALRITASSRTGNLVDLTFASVSGKKYTAQFSANLTSWEDTGSVVTASDASTTISGIAAGAPAQYFYRIRLVP